MSTGPVEQRGATTAGRDDRMPRYTVNDDAVRHARELIDDGQVDVDTPWSQAAPSAADENDEIDAEGREAWAAWHLGVNQDANEGTKARYAFPYGDFEKVNRAALIHAEQRASQNDHTEIAKAAKQLLERLDER
jgi:hypothetical protein